MSATVSWPLGAVAGGSGGTPGPGVRQVRAVRRGPGAPGPAAVPTGESGPLRLTRRGRLVLGLAAVVLAGAGIVATGSAQAGSSHQGTEVTRHVVAPGETLWGLARTVADRREDVRDVVAEIERLNRLEGSAVRAGAVLLLPLPRG